MHDEQKNSFQHEFRYIFSGMSSIVTCLQTRFVRLMIFSNRYNTKDFVIITYKPNENLFSQDSFKNIKNLKSKLENLENVDEVITLIDLPLLKTANVPLKRLNADKMDAEK